VIDIQNFVLNLNESIKEMKGFVKTPLFTIKNVKKAINQVKSIGKKN